MESLNCEKDNENYCDFCKRETEIKTDYIEGTKVCQSCGLVLQRNPIDTTVEYRIFSETNPKRNDPRRVGGIYNYKLADGGFALDIDGGKDDDFLKMLKRLNAHLNQNEDLMWHQTGSFIRKWCNALDLDTRVLLKAEEIFYTLDREKKAFNKQKLDSLSVAVICIASKQCHCPLKPQRLAKVADISIKELVKSYHLIKHYFPCLSSEVDAATYCEIFTNALGISDDMRSLMRAVVMAILEKSQVWGRNPRTIAATAIYIVTLLSKNEAKTLGEIFNIADISTNAIKTCYHDLYGTLDELIPTVDNLSSIDMLPEPSMPMENSTQKNCQNSILPRAQSRPSNLLEITVIDE